MLVALLLFHFVYWTHRMWIFLLCIISTIMSLLCACACVCGEKRGVFLITCWFYFLRGQLLFALFIFTCKQLFPNSAVLRKQNWAQFKLHCVSVKVRSVEVGIQEAPKVTSTGIGIWTLLVYKYPFHFLKCCFSSKKRW